MSSTTSSSSPTCSATPLASSLSWVLLRPHLDVLNGGGDEEKKKEGFLECDRGGVVVEVEDCEMREGTQ